METKVITTKIPRPEYTIFLELCNRETKTVSQKIRELIFKELNKEHGTEILGKKRKFFVPAENKFMDVVEVEE
jgi:hypothetical protein